MEIDLSYVILGSVGWILVEQYRSHACIKRIEANQRNLISTVTQHINDDKEAFLRIENRLDKT